MYIIYTLKNPPLVCTVGGNDRLDNFDHVIEIGWSPSAVHIIWALSPRLTTCRVGFKTILGGSKICKFFGYCIGK